MGLDLRQCPPCPFPATMHAVMNNPAIKSIAAVISGNRDPARIIQFFSMPFILFSFRDPVSRQSCFGEN